ncbi:MAG: adenylosuccinate lyase, partial [Acetobacteraceae bacterium]|nr:adenylosuccinate lyase [Acetobacteraceae bacterium]
IVQRNAMETWTRLGEPGAQTFRENLERDPEISGRLPPGALDAAMDTGRHLQAVDHVFRRVFGRRDAAARAA